MTTVATERPAAQARLNVDVLMQELRNDPELREQLAAAIGGNGTVVRRRKMSYEAFLDWADEDTLAEWVHGEVIMSSPASLLHQELAGFLYRMLTSHVFFRNLGTVIQAPFQMKMEHGREPDILFVARQHQDRLRGTYLDGPADLVVEIVSPESIGRDRGDKFYEYERGGIPEYWLIDPLTQRAEFYQRSAETQRYVLTPFDSDGVYRSAMLPGFWLRVDWLWQDPLPHPLPILGEIAGVDAQEVSRFMRLLQGAR